MSQQTLWQDARLIAHYFRTKPRLAFRCFVVNPVKKHTACRVHGHKAGTGRGSFYQLLGLCDRCVEPIHPAYHDDPTTDPDHPQE